MKVIYQSEEARVVQLDSEVIIGLRQWDHFCSIPTEIWMQLVQAWLDSHEVPPAPAGEVWTISKDRLALFIREAEALSLLTTAWRGGQKVVKLRNVKELLFNLASGRAPDEAQPPSWAGKDCVGALRRRGWEITKDGEGMQRRGFFISGVALQGKAYEGGVESTADILESEFAERTDREDKR